MKRDTQKALEVLEHEAQSKETMLVATAQKNELLRETMLKITAKERQNDEELAKLETIALEMQSGKETMARLTEELRDIDNKRAVHGVRLMDQGTPKATAAVQEAERMALAQREAEEMAEAEAAAAEEYAAAGAAAAAAAAEAAAAEEAAMLKAEKVKKIRATAASFEAQKAQEEETEAARDTKAMLVVYRAKNVANSRGSSAPVPLTVPLPEMEETVALEAEPNEPALGEQAPLPQQRILAPSRNLWTFCPVF